MRTTHLLLGIALVATVTVQRPSIGLEPGIFKMHPLGGGGALPAEGPVIKVPYDRIQRRYVAIDEEPLSLRVKVSASCAKIKFQGLALDAAGQRIPVSTSGLSKTTGTCGGFSGTTTVTTSKVTTAALADVVPNPVATCNADLASFVQQDQHGKAQKGWARQYDNVLPIELNAFCRDEPKKGLGFSEAPHATLTDSARSPVWLHCGPAAVFRTETSSAGVKAKKSGLQSAHVFVNPPANADYRGSCPKELAFGGEIQYLRAPGPDPVTVRYRYRTHDGAVSPILTTAVMESGKKNITYWKREFGGGSPTGALAAPGGGSGSRVVQGWVQLEVLASDNEVIEQDRANFKLTCEPQRVAASYPSKVAMPDIELEKGTIPPNIELKKGITSNLKGTLADLIVKSWQPAPTSPTTLRIEVANVGAADSPATDLAVFYHRSGRIMKKSFDVPTLQAGQSRWIVADLRSPLANAERLTARINDSGNVKESNGTNNAFTVK